MLTTLFPQSEMVPDWRWGDLAGGYELIMADPPWHFALWSAEGEEKSPQAHYDTMTLADIMALRVDYLAAPDCLLWLWATAPMLPQALEVLAAWRFTYVTMGCWHKTTRHGRTQFGPGYVLRSAGEPYLIGKRGKPKTTHATRNIVVGEVREHSRKPEAAYRDAEALMPDARRLDLFSRASRPGWDAWGNEAGKFDQGGDDGAGARVVVRRSAGRAGSRSAGDDVRGPLL